MKDLLPRFLQGLKQRPVLAAVVIAGVVLVFWLGNRPGGTDGRKFMTPRERVMRGLNILRTGKAKTDEKLAFTEVKQALRQMDVAEARGWILEQIESGEDFITQLELTIGSGQNLAAWPSYRVFLLDMLMLVDPAAAAEKAREILQSPGSPDEWAVALRNLARGGSSAEDARLLDQKAAEMLRNKDWLDKPSSGFLQAFDVIVHTGNTAVVPDLMSFCDDKERRAVRHAAFLALDRLVVTKPEALLPVLGRTAHEHPASGLMISNMMARGDVRDARQREAVESYLTDEKRTDEELRGFASVFPNANMSVSDNLLTQAPTIKGTELAAMDQASLDAVAGWIDNPSFKRCRPMLLEVYKRLRGFAGG